MNRVILICSILVLIVIALLVFLRQNKDYIPIKEGPIVLFGDSLVEGIGSSPGGDIASVLSVRFGVPVVNKGVSGNTTEDALSRVDTDVVSLEPSIVVVIIGGNDFLRRVPKTTTINNLRTIIEKIQSSGSSIILAGIDPLVYNNDYKNIAKDYDIGFIPNILGLTHGKDALMSDNIHPNDAGYLLFADVVEKEILNLL